MERNRNRLISGRRVRGRNQDQIELEPASGPQVARLPFRKIGRNYNCGFVDREDMVIRSQSALKEMWETFYQFSLYPPPVREVDFNSVMWICVFRGQFPTWGYTTEIRFIAEIPATGLLWVHVSETNPSRWMYVKQEFSQPFHIVELERRELPVRFTYNERTRWL